MTITRHKKLDPKLWLNNEHIKPDVRDMLLAISWNLIDFIRNRYALNIHNSDIKDIIMFGSTANYFYTKKSDIDICIVMDITALEQQYPNMNIMKMLKLYYYDWAMVHTCSIRGRKIDLNFEIYGAPQFNGRYRTGANYSIMHDDWIFKPIIIPRNELRDIVHQGNTIYKQIIHDYKQLRKLRFPPQDTERFYTNFVKLRRDAYGASCDQVIIPLYIAVRKTKNKKIVEKLHKKLVHQETKKFTLK